MNSIAHINNASLGSSIRFMQLSWDRPCCAVHMTSFTRFLLVLAIATAVLLICGGNPFVGLPVVGAVLGAAFAGLTVLASALGGLVFGAFGVATGLLALLVPLLVLLTPAFLFIGLVVLIAKSASH